MQNIATRLNVSEEELAKKIKSIKTQYRREYTKQLQHEKNGLSSSAREKEWFGYRPLSFLRKNITSKETDSPDQEDTGEEDNEEKDDAKSSESSSEAENSVACPTEKTYLKARINREKIQLPGSNNQNLKRKIHDELFNSTPKQNSPLRGQEIKNHLKDDLQIYGENVASRMRNSLQGYREIAIARHEIDKILFRLEMGEFR
ncbi:uncharacterized protein LOC129958087 isoform X2 [Argiope bruennichi]|nr:uncharacterized protein LOC129958087 isoform X2 [Argiope bruennichi]XP_055926251.1 uncharacterized protein LOC129958087 isoform X2 [Argiope bruennichi]